MDTKKYSCGLKLARNNSSLALLFQALKPLKIYLTFSVIAMVLYSSEVVMRPFFVGRLIDSINDKDSLLVARVAFYVLLSQILFYFSKRLYEWSTFKYEPDLKARIKELAIKYLVSHEYAFFQSHFSGNLVSKINDLSNCLPSILTICVNGYLVSFLSVITSLCVLWYIHLPLAIAFSIWVIFILSSSTLYLTKIHHLTKNLANLDSNITANALDLIDNILCLKIFSGTKHELSRFKNLQDEHLEKNKKYNMLIFIFYLIQGSSFILYQGFCLLILTDLQKDGLISAGLFVMILIINLRVLDNLWLISYQMRTFSDNLGTISQATSLLFSHPKIYDLPNAPSLRVLEGKIVFQDVTFHYENCPPLFENLSLTLNPGEKVGIVGHSGGGKSTFINLILRLFEATRGAILIDGQSIKEISQESLWSAISLIPQNTSLFHRTIIENIRYARPEASDEDVYAAAQKAHLHEFISHLPLGYNTLVGDKGLKLSGGQRQRLAIARVFLKDSPIIILDESTSQLDSITEKQIHSSLMHLMKNKTTIVIAHRLSTLVEMDRILLLHKGKIIQDGTHDKLRTNGLYKRLWDIQMKGKTHHA